MTTDDGTDATQRSRRDLGGGEKQTGPSGGVEVAVPDPGLGMGGWCAEAGRDGAGL